MYAQALVTFSVSQHLAVKVAQQMQGKRKKKKTEHKKEPASNGTAKGGAKHAEATEASALNGEETGKSDQALKQKKKRKPSK